MNTFGGKRYHRLDFSDYLAHFSTERAPVGANDSNNPANRYSSTSAVDKLISILREGRIVASIMPWVSRRAVCFTECPWPSLLDHAQRYSPYTDD